MSRILDRNRSAGCIIAEMAMGIPLFPGSSSRDELDRIFKLLGTPDPSIWTPELKETPDYKLLSGDIQEYASGEGGLAALLVEKMGKDGVDLVARMLVYQPEGRITAQDALRHPFFKDELTL
jgi:serine/threonine protein kinase